MSATEDAIALLRSRVDHHRIGRSTWREMDHDIIAMRKAIELLEQAPTVDVKSLTEHFTRLLDGDCGSGVPPYLAERTLIFLGLAPEVES